MHIQGLNCCKLSRLVYVSRSLATRSRPPRYPPKTHRKNPFPARFPVTQRPFRVLKEWLQVASTFHHKGRRQPGKEHVMEPTPQFESPDYKPSNKLHGMVALVTGGDSGIGRAVCRSFALEGATVAFTFVKAHEDKDAQDTLMIIKKSKTPDAKEPMAMAADLGYDETCRMVVDEVVNAYGRIDILLNNAAEQHKTTSVEEIDEERLERVFRTNVFSYFFTVRHALKHMKAGSSIINTTSVTAYRGSKRLIDYSATKGAIVAYTRALALHLVQRGIRVNGVAPGPIWTPLIPASFSEEECAKFGSDVPMGRAGQPAEVAPACVSCLQPLLLLHDWPGSTPQWWGRSEWLRGCRWKRAFWAAWRALAIYLFLVNFSFGLYMFLKVGP